LAVIAGVVFAIPILLILGMGLLALTASWGDRAFPDALTWLNLTRVTVTAPRPLLITLIVSAITILVALALGTLASYQFQRRPQRGDAALQFSLNMPMVLPGIALGIGMIAAYNAPPLALHPSPFLLILS